MWWLKTVYIEELQIASRCLRWKTVRMMLLFSCFASTFDRRVDDQNKVIHHHLQFVSDSII